MRIGLLLSIVLLSITIDVKAQNLLFLGNNSYQATPKVDFQGNGRRNASFIIAKKSDGSGLLSLTSESLTGVVCSGDTYLYLDDASKITLVDRKIYDLKDDNATTVYKLTSTELQKLSSVTINTIRFTMKCGKCISSTEEGVFTVSNRSGFFQMSLGSSDRVDTAQLLASLLGNVPEEAASTSEETALSFNGRKYKSIGPLPLNFDGKHDLSFDIAKRDATHALVAVGFGTSIKEFQIEGPITITMANGNSITTLNAIGNDYIDSESISYYVLDLVAIGKMRGSMLRTIKFKTKCTTCDGKIPTEEHLAKNDFSDRTDVNNYLGTDNSNNVEYLFGN